MRQLRQFKIHSFVMYASAIPFIEDPIEGDTVTDIDKGDEYTYHNGKWSKTSDLEAEEAIKEDAAAKETELLENLGEVVKKPRRGRGKKELG